MVERKTFPREKTCGDGLTPRAVKKIQDMGLGEELTKYHRFDGLRCTAQGRSLELPWPEHPVFPPYGYVVRRRELDWMVAQNAEVAGATLLQGTDAIAPVIDRGFVRGAVVESADATSPYELCARYVVVADGANSRFGRALGTFRTKEWPYGTAIRTYWESPRHDEPWIESALDVEDRNGNPLPGYGWIFPVGDGTVNIGVGLLSTFRDFKSVNTTHLLDSYAHMVADRWEIDAAHPTARPVSGRIPMGGSVGPKQGPTYLVVGDAAGSVNPFNGEGIDYAYETAHMAADAIHQALVERNPLALADYPQAAAGRVRPVLQGGPPVRPGHRAAGADAGAHPGRHAQPHAHGVGAADHGQPPPSRRGRPGRSRVPRRGGHRPPRPRRLTGFAPELCDAPFRSQTSQAHHSRVLDIDRRLTALAASQHWLLTRRQAADMGLSWHALDSRIRRGILDEPVAGVLRVRAAPPTDAAGGPVGDPRWWWPRGRVASCCRGAPPP